MSQHNVAPVCCLGETTSGVNGIENGKRHVGDGLLAGFVHLPGDIGLLRAESGDINVHLRVSNVLR